MLRFQEPAAIDATDWAVAKARERVLRPLIERGGRPDPAEVADAAAMLGITPRWLRTLICRFRADPRTSVLVPDGGGRPHGRQMLNPIVEAIVAERITAFYATPQRPGLGWLVDEVERACRRHGLAPPTRKTVSCRLKMADPKALLAKREGRKVARDRYGPVRERFEPALRPLQLVQIDHTRVDLIAVDEAHREPIGRPWLTVAIDVFSRVVVGYHLTLEAPSTLSVDLCLAHVVADKRPWLTRLGVDAEWPAGLPEALHLDNAAEFRSEALVRGCEEHGIIINYRPVATPHYGGHVERLIGSTMGEVHLLPGTTFSSAAERGVYQSEREAAMTLAELDLWLTRQIAVVYHGRVHRGIERTPLGLWREAVASGAPFRPVPDPDRVRLDFLPFEHRRARRDGVELFKLAYWHDALPAIAARCSTKLPVRYDPRDLSRVWLRPPGEREYLELCYKDIRKPPVTLWEWRAARRLLLAQGAREVHREALFEAVEAQRRHVADCVAKTRRAKRERRLQQRTASARDGAGRDYGSTPAATERGEIDYSRPPKTYTAEEWS